MSKFAGLDSRLDDSELCNVIRQKISPSLADLIPETLRERNRSLPLVQARHTIKDPAGRFFLALLLNVPDRASFLKLVAAAVIPVCDDGAE